MLSRCGDKGIVRETEESICDLWLSLSLFFLFLLEPEANWWLRKMNPPRE